MFIKYHVPLLKVELWGGKRVMVTRSAVLMYHIQESPKKYLCHLLGENDLLSVAMISEICQKYRRMLGVKLLKVKVTRYVLVVVNVFAKRS